jgi:hypothetical protein
MKVTKALLCHGLTDDFTPTILRPSFHADDKYVILLLALDDISNSEFNIFFTWTSVRGFQIKSNAVYSDNIKSVTTFSYISPFHLRAEKSLDPTGLWTVKVLFDQTRIIYTASKIEPPIRIYQPTYFDMKV